jgi:hypothetical protein
MALFPGRRYVDEEIRIEVMIQDEDGTALDPDTVKLRLYSPSGTETSYTYAAGEVHRDSAGQYYCDFEPDESGRWHWRWETTGTGKALTRAGSFVVQSSPWHDDAASDYGR